LVVTMFLSTSGIFLTHMSSNWRSSDPLPTFSDVRFYIKGIRDVYNVGCFVLSFKHPFLLMQSFMCFNKSCLVFFVISLSDAGSLPGRLAERRHDVPAERSKKQLWHTPARWEIAATTCLIFSSFGI